MAAKAQVAWNKPTRRRDPRRVSALPLDITVVRANRSDRMPGRCLNVSARGLAAAVAGELRDGEVVAIEMNLPTEAQRWRADAVVRHGGHLDHGFEFSDLAIARQKSLLQWLRSDDAEPGVAPYVSDELPPDPEKPRESRAWRWFKRVCLVLVLILAFLAGVVWRWRSGWKDIESRAPAKIHPARKLVPEARVPAEEMQKRLLHRVDPDYPDVARDQKISGIVVLDVVVGRDGTVVEVDPESGPEILTRAAVEAVRWWQFQPFEINGQPAIVGTTVAVEFKP